MDQKLENPCITSLIKNDSDCYFQKKKKKKKK